MRAIRWASVVAYGRLNPIRAAGLIGIPHSVYVRQVTEWSEKGVVVIDGWEIGKCPQCGAPVIKGEKHGCLKRINRVRRPPRRMNANGEKECQWCGNMFKPLKNGAGISYCCTECSRLANNARSRANNRKMREEMYG